MADWKDIFMDEDPVSNPTVDLPKDNEKPAEKEAAGQPAAGDLPEDDDPKGVKNEPAGDHPDFTGDKPSAAFDELLNIFDKLEKEDEEAAAAAAKGDQGSADANTEKALDAEKKGKKAEGADDDTAEDDGKEEKKDPEKELKDLFNFLDENPDPVPPVKVDLPKENEQAGEKEAAGQPAAGALPEKDDPNGMKTEPFGQDEISKQKSTEYDDVLNFFDKKDDDDAAGDDEGEDGGKDEGEKADGEKPEDDDKAEKPADKGSDDDGASKSAPLEGDDKGKKKEDENDEVIKDLASFFDDANVAEPDGLPSGSTAKPAEPVDGNGNDVCPIGEPDPKAKLTEPIKVPVASPAGGHDGELKNTMNMFDEDNSRFSFGDFSF